MKYVLTVNTVDCVGCYSCEIACKQQNNLPVGPRLIRVNSDGPQLIDGKQQLRYTVSHCVHCAKPPCKDVCSVRAISIREDGIAVIAEELCNGCGNCIQSCPYGAMQLDELNKVARKCDLCVERLDKGLKPVCVAACPSHCIHFGDEKQVTERLGKKIR